MKLPNFPRDRCWPNLPSSPNLPPWKRAFSLPKLSQFTDLFVCLYVWRCMWSTKRRNTESFADSTLSQQQWKHPHNNHIYTYTHTHTHVYGYPTHLKMAQMQQYHHQCFIKCFTVPVRQNWYPCHTTHTHSQTSLTDNVFYQWQKALHN